MPNSFVTLPYSGIYYIKQHFQKGEIILNVQGASFLTIPSPCGLAISSVTSDGEFLYALQPDRKTVYKLDVCGRIICIFKLSRRYTSLHYCSNGRFYATSENEPNRIYILNRCFAETGFIEPDFSASNCSCNCTSQSVCGNTRRLLFIGPAGDCNDTNCMLTVATATTAYAADQNGRLLANLSSAGRNNSYTAIAENGGILFEGLESTSSPQTYIRATLLSTGQTKVQRLPYGYRIRSFFCYGGYLYVFFTKNSFRGFVAPICLFVSNGVLCGEIIALPESPYDSDCADESCNCTCLCKCTACDSSHVSSNQTGMCSDSSVSGDSTTDDCNIDELCKLFNCIKKLCKTNCSSNNAGCACGCSCNNGCYGGGSNGCVNGCTNGCGNSCVSGCNTGNCCCSGNLNCSCFPQCTCADSDIGGDSCLPLPACPQNPCCEPCPPCDNSAATNGNLRVSFSAT